MTTTQDTLKEAYVAHAAKRWDSAVQDVRRYFRYDHKDSAVIHELAKKMLTVSDSTLRSVFCQKGGYGHHFGGLVELLEFIPFFLGHEIMDDGIPGIGYTYVDMKNHMKVKPCGPNHPKARPCFHRESFPDAEMLTAEDALRILTGVEATHERLQEMRLSSSFRAYTDKDRDYLKNGSKEDQQRRALAEELAGETPEGLLTHLKEVLEQATGLGYWECAFPHYPCLYTNKDCLSVSGDGLTQIKFRLQKDGTWVLIPIQDPRLYEKVGALHRDKTLVILDPPMSALFHDVMGCHPEEMVCVAGEGELEGVDGVPITPLDILRLTARLVKAPKGA